MSTPGRRLDAALHLLDRQILDREGRMAGKVDDVELDERRDGALVVTALLTGPGAWGARLPGWLGRAVLAVWRRLHQGENPEPVRIAVGLVTEIGSAVRLSVVRDELGNQNFEQWAEERIITKLPGASHAGE